MFSDFVTAVLFSIVGVIAAAIGAILTDAVKELAVVIAAGSAIGAFLGSLFAVARGQDKKEAENLIWLCGIAGAGFAAYLFVFERLLGV